MIQGILELIRHALLKAAYPLNEWLGRTHLPFTHKETWDIPHGHLNDGLSFRYNPGYVLLSHTRGSLTNLVIPGYWTHAAIIGPKRTVLEAVGEGVVSTPISKFILSKDHVCILEPKMANADDLKQIADVASQQVGRPYDYQFRGGNEAFYCAELIGYTYREILGREVFSPRMTLGEPTYTPQDFYEAKSKFRVVWDSEETW
jgi:hypothetical protein